jgi:hypothetical protein
MMIRRGKIFSPTRHICIKPAITFLNFVTKVTGKLGGRTIGGNSSIKRLTTVTPGKLGGRTIGGNSAPVNTVSRQIAILTFCERAITGSSYFYIVVTYFKKNTSFIRANSSLS